MASVSQLVELLEQPDLDLRRHPFTQLVASGDADVGLLRRWFISYAPLITDGVVWMGHLYIDAPNAEVRGEIAENLYEEVTGKISGVDVSHPQLFARFGEAIGVTVEQARQQSPEEARTFYDLLRDGLADRWTFAESIGVVGATEYYLPGVYKQMVPRLRKMGLSGDDLRFFTMHISVDEEHGDTGLRLAADSVAPGDDDRFFTTVHDALALLYRSWPSN